jgi:hypothetical protein
MVCNNLRGNEQMLTQSSQGFSHDANIKSKSVSTAKSRRTMKLIVEMSIGIIGLIGIMLAQIAESNAAFNGQNSHKKQGYEISNIGNNFSEKVETLSQVPPAVSQITLTNILF